VAAGHLLVVVRHTRHYSYLSISKRLRTFGDRKLESLVCAAIMGEIAS
jgi:hypothetical protein